MVSGNEYLPEWTTFQKRPLIAPDMSLYENLDWFFTVNDVPEGVSVQQSDSAEHRTGERFSIDSDFAFPLQIRQMYFPGWKAALNGEPIETAPSGDEGLLTVQIPAGSHTLEVWYGGTTAQHLGDSAALLGILICVFLFVWELRRKIKNRHPAPPIQHQRFAFGVLALSLGWMVFNQVYLIPKTDWFRPRSPVTEPAAMQTRYTEQFFQPGIGFRLELMGYTLENGNLNAGDELDLMLFWRTLGPIDASPALKIVLTSRDQQHVYGELISSPITGQHPAKWGLDHYAVERLRIPVNADNAPTIAQIRLMVYGDEIWKTGSDTTEIILREIHIDGQQTMSGDAVKAETRFGEAIQLIGYMLERDTSNVYLQLYWAVREAPSQVYMLALHYWRDGKFIENHDQPPLGINYQTSEWRKGEILQSYIGIPLPDNDADELRIGLYDPESGVRLPVRGGNYNVENDLLILKLKH
ncbi:MAG TPA: hypothetical protein VJZ27_10165 [Aggregatilineales bacterium]|nr:hypothetical protein [Aggregatilineales bacterium]